MPIYEYRCASCGHELEALQKIADPALTACPSCRQDTLTKLVSAAGFQLKGSGWYATDFRGGSTKPAAPNAAKAPVDGAAGESKNESKSESAPAAASGGCGGSCACH
jgi:putative FmdB family regulatory protein